MEAILNSNLSNLSAVAAETAAKDNGGAYLTQDEAASHLRLSPRTLERHRVNGTGARFVRLGRRVVYARAELDAWTASRTFASTAEADAAA
jgi:predicted DNA-binding transcriptional regulator AlpA